MDIDEFERELAWFQAVLEMRLRVYFSDPAAPSEGSCSLAQLPPPVLGDSPTPWARLVHLHAPGLLERLALTLVLVRELRPSLLDLFLARHPNLGHRYTEFGGVVGNQGFEPTGETLAFLLDGDGLAARLAVEALLAADQPLRQQDLLRVVHQGDEPILRSPLRFSPTIWSQLTTGRVAHPPLGAAFPAQRLSTALTWSDLVLHPATLRQLEEIHTFLEHGETLPHGWGMAARLRPGFRALFHGPSGTGKTLSAALLGQKTGREVQRVDLSLLVSKYIGETEKNLARVFEQAEQRGWILFFDEADALFGKRSDTKDAHDRYANQEVAYLLQRIECFAGVALLASNLHQNLDEAFLRRFEAVVYFPPPRPEERLRLWREGFSIHACVTADLERIAREHELSGGAIINVIRKVSLAAIARSADREASSGLDGTAEIGEVEIEAAIRSERNKTS